MEKIKILGTGCPKCKQTEKVVRNAVLSHHMEVDIEKVDDIVEILKYNVIATPAIVIGERVIIQGKVPEEEEVWNYINKEIRKI
jgi:small redox-active disulfide protein 2